MVTDNLVAPGRRLVIFDLCDTLYDANTTVDFIYYYQSLHADRRTARVLRRWLSRASPLFYLGALTQRLLGWDIARQRIVAALAGETRTNLVEAATDYVRNVLPLRANPLLLDRLKFHVAAGDNVMLLSSSLDLVVAEVASVLGVGYRASRLGFDGGRCTGRLEQDLTGRKTAAIGDLIEKSSGLCVYTDNRSDRDLIAIADRATIVIPKGGAAELWGGSSCEYIRP